MVDFTLFSSYGCFLACRPVALILPSQKSPFTSPVFATITSPTLLHLLLYFLLLSLSKF